MTGPPPLVDYQRSGGRRPSDDEQLVIEDDGRFRGRRTVGGARVGTFAGELASDTLADIAQLSEAAADAGDLQLPIQPDGAGEWVQTRGPQARLGSNEQPAGAWGTLVERLRRLLDDELVAAPLAALELVLDGPTARLVGLGEGELEIDAASIATRTVRLDADGGLLGRGGASATGERTNAREGRWLRCGATWSQELELGQALELASGEWLQVWVTLRIREDGLTREARLFVARQG